MGWGTVGPIQEVKEGSRPTRAGGGQRWRVAVGPIWANGGGEVKGICTKNVA